MAEAAHAEVVPPWPAAAADPIRRRTQRFLEIVPTALVWVVISAPVWGSWLAPEALGVFLVAFSIYWIWKSASFAGGVVIGFWRMGRAERRDWQAEASALPGYDDLQHVALIPTYGESDAILADTLHHLAAQDTPRDRISVVLAFEERDPAAPARAQTLAARFAPLFRELLVTFHPDLPGEVKGKSSNLAWAARRVEQEWIATGKLDPSRMLVTVCDADSRLHRKYLSALSQQVLGHPDGRYHIFQPAILFYANHWRLPAPLRAMNSIYSLWELARLVPSHRLVTQSTYSLSWSAARAVGFWDVDIIPEDSRMFFKVFFHFGRQVRVRPIFLPVYADAAEGPTLGRTLVNHYHQIQRWAWGVSDLPYVVSRAMRAHHLPLHTRVARVGWYAEEHFMWPTHWFLLTLGGLIPPWLNPEYARSATGLWQQSLISAIFSLGIPCLAVVIYVDWRLRPQHPDGEDALDVLYGWAAYGLLPVVSFFLSTLPALDAHTRLLFGRYLEYRVTEKVPVRSRFRGHLQVGAGPVAVLEPVRVEELVQHRTYAPGGSTTVADSVLGGYRELR